MCVGGRVTDHHGAPNIEFLVSLGRPSSLFSSFFFSFLFFFAQPTPADEAHAEEKAFVPLALPERKTWAEFKTTLE